MLEDDNPIALWEAHPDKLGNALNLGERDAQAWVDSIGEALALIAEQMPTLYEEMKLFVQRIVPVGYHDKLHLSASYAEAIGTLYLTLHPQRMVMAEALIHEFSHNKLNALFEVDEVLVNAFTSLHSSPVRPDPRPLHGVLLAAHAFLPVATLYERMLDSGTSAGPKRGLSSAPGQDRQLESRGDLGGARVRGAYGGGQGPARGTRPHRRALRRALLRR